MIFLEEFLFAIYVITVITVCIIIIIDTVTPSKALAYLLLVITVPILGIIFYLSFGLNYRKRKIYDKKLVVDDRFYKKLEDKIDNFKSKRNRYLDEQIDYFRILADFKSDKNLVSIHNKLSLLTNGEEKFPEVLNAIKSAKHHIHIEYYIYDNDIIGNQLADLLIEKQKEGVVVRFIYDDFGSRKIRKNIVRRLRRNGVKAFPFNKIILIYLANRLNYRNHRKIIVIDGKVGFVGGINVSDKYINNGKQSLYWRDTHLKIEGSAVLNLQYTFLNDWNFCSDENIDFDFNYFPVNNFLENHDKSDIVQVVASGPDSDYPGIMYSIVQLLILSKKELCITTPYFIPSRSILDALKITALSGVDVKLLVPLKSDSLLVNLTSESFYSELLEAGIRIFRYKKGFIHAKTIVCDDKISVIGTANLDNRSFDLNFEINAISYAPKLAQELKDNFYNDIEDADELIYNEWNKRSIFRKMIEKFVKLFSSLM